MNWVFYALFAAGAGMVWSAWLSLLLKVRPDTIQAMIERFWLREQAAGLQYPEVTAQERLFVEKARLAGVTWSFRTFQRLRWFIGGSFVYIGLAFSLPEWSPGVSWRIGEALRLLGIGGALGGIGWYAPAGFISLLAARRRAEVLLEISKFAHRLSICMSDQADIRELILRAGRPLRWLKPHIQKLAGQWGNDQREAILAFKDGVGISEVYPLVNAFAAISRAKSSDVSRLLVEHSRSIDASLESELAKRIENAPLWISFYIMLPFLVCLLLFVYPWVLTVLEQLTVSFTAG
jgi:hypothetical protein